MGRRYSRLTREGGTVRTFGDRMETNSDRFTVGSPRFRLERPVTDAPFVCSDLDGGGGRDTVTTSARRTRRVTKRQRRSTVPLPDVTIGGGVVGGRSGT
ncbi:hypothetical protein HUG10_11885 [Halorarum halophilum]|uniref:Uncharacterized protein n=1 Tax=Halorarum halophilum TaxID=2743090 RepID=A0A7D5GFF8_9EURY|nr:hypothetical protein [Halobaculum halophilum]QLG28208.1 hypothetical protein HUG10_11885 [Halobaculum halophilum]